MHSVQCEHAVCMGPSLSLSLSLPEFEFTADSLTRTTVDATAAPRIRLADCYLADKAVVT